MNFLNNLTDLLRLHNMKRTDLGRALNIPASTINSWYNRSPDGIALNTLVKIASYFNVTLDDLVNSEDIEKAIIPTKIEIETPFTNEEVLRLKRILQYFEMVNSYKEEGGKND